MLNYVVGIIMVYDLVVVHFIPLRVGIIYWF